MQDPVALQGLQQQQEEPQTDPMTFPLLFNPQHSSTAEERQELLIQYSRYPHTPTIYDEQQLEEEESSRSKQNGKGGGAVFRSISSTTMLCQVIVVTMMLIAIIMRMSGTWLFDPIAGDVSIEKGGLSSFRDDQELHNFSSTNLVLDSSQHGSSTTSVFRPTTSATMTGRSSVTTTTTITDTVSPCHRSPCFVPAPIRVDNHHRVSSSPSSAFPSFWKYAHNGPIDVSYDNRTVLLNGDRVLLLGGSMHPSRATHESWNQALDDVVAHGLNLITIYVMWSAHQPFVDSTLDWGFPTSSTTTFSQYQQQQQDCVCDPKKENRGETRSANTTNSSSSSSSCNCDWNLGTAIRAAAERGLFVHLRVGPYDCAEYNYGGIPEWLPLKYPTMIMRRPNREWMMAMRTFVSELVHYIDGEELWAHQGGNIILAQIENELGDEDETKNANKDGFHQQDEVIDPALLLVVDETSHKFVDPRTSNAAVLSSSGRQLRNATLQDYAEWSGRMAQKLAPNVTWTMCNGLYANNTILTANSIGGGASWLEHYGGNGHIQVDQPALNTEFEGGFQVWGETPDEPIDYFWGRTARDMARDAMKWFARGGSHLNYYMVWGGYNRGRAAAAGIANKYANDVAICPSGIRREPKFSHFQALHEVLISVSKTLVNAPTAVGKARALRHRNASDTGPWQNGTEQRMFEYISQQFNNVAEERVLFVENDGNTTTFVEIPNCPSLKMAPFSSVIMVNGIVKFDSAEVDAQAMSFKRQFAKGDDAPKLQDWTSWEEVIGAPKNSSSTFAGNAPVEQTTLHMLAGVDSDYVWYESTLNTGSNDLQTDAVLCIDSQRANGILLFIDDEFVGAAEDHLHKEGPVTFCLKIPSITPSEHKISILSESLGYHNLIGRWGGSVKAKPKGLTGNVTLALTHQGKVYNTSLVDGREWTSFPSLHGEVETSITRRTHFVRRDGSQLVAPMWASAFFDTPKYDISYQRLFLHVTEGRGHIWLNGHDLGRYWNITRGPNTQVRSQEFYLLPHDFLKTDGNRNQITLFDAFGGDSYKSAELSLSWLVSTDDPSFQDEIDFPGACL